MSVPFFAKALFEYEAVEESELSVTAGDFLTVEEVNESGWCLVRGHSTATAIVKARARGNAATGVRAGKAGCNGTDALLCSARRPAAAADVKRPWAVERLTHSLPDLFIRCYPGSQG